MVFSLNECLNTSRDTAGQTVVIRAATSIPGVGATENTAGGAARGTMTEVVARMETIDSTLPRTDGVAYFNRLYLAVTKAVLAASSGTTFRDPQFLTRLDVVFAGLYFAAESTIATGAECPVAWRPLFEERSAAHAPIRFALAGMNAHINHDLALAIVQTCTERGVAPEEGTPQYADYEEVNAILRQVEGQVAAWFETGIVADIEDVVPKEIDNALALWSISAARQLAWEHAEMIWRLASHADLVGAYEDTLARATELSSRAMLV
jgi:Family of unknown function (DUF5995)